MRVRVDAAALVRYQQTKRSHVELPPVDEERPFNIPAGIVRGGRGYSAEPAGTRIFCGGGDGLPRERDFDAAAGYLCTIQPPQRASFRASAATIASTSAKSFATRMPKPLFDMDAGLQIHKFVASGSFRRRPRFLGSSESPGCGADADLSESNAPAAAASRANASLKRSCSASPKAVRWYVSGMKFEAGSRPLSGSSQYARVVFQRPSLLTRTVLCSRWLHATLPFCSRNRFRFLYL